MVKPSLRRPQDGGHAVAALALQLMVSLFSLASKAIGLPVWYEFGAQPHSPHKMHGAYLERSQVSWEFF